jgi:hypothetical protein
LENRVAEYNMAQDKVVTPVQTRERWWGACARLECTEQWQFSKCVTHYICGTCGVTIRIKMKGGQSIDVMLPPDRTSEDGDPSGTYNDKISDSAHPDGSRYYIVKNKRGRPRRSEKRIPVGTDERARRRHAWGQSTNNRWAEDLKSEILVLCMRCQKDGRTFSMKFHAERSSLTVRVAAHDATHVDAPSLTAEQLKKT